MFSAKELGKMFGKIAVEAATETSTPDPKAVPGGLKPVKDKPVTPVQPDKVDPSFSDKLVGGMGGSGHTLLKNKVDPNSFSEKLVGGMGRGHTLF